MKKVYWITSDGNDNQWQNSHYFSHLIEDITGFDLDNNLCTECVKHMAKRLNETPYQRRFKSLYTIYEDEYKSMVKKFNSEANNNGKIVVK